MWTLPSVTRRDSVACAEPLFVTYQQLHPDGAGRCERPRPLQLTDSLCNISLVAELEQERFEFLERERGLLRTRVSCSVNVFYDLDLVNVS